MKTDKTETSMLAAFADLPATEPKSGFLDRLNDLTAARGQLVETIKKLRQRRDDLQDASAKKVMDKAAEAAERRKEALEAGIEEHIKSDPDQARAYRILMSVPGIGPVTAAALLGRLDSRRLSPGPPRSPATAARRKAPGASGADLLPEARPLHGGFDGCARQ